MLKMVVQKWIKKWWYELIPLLEQTIMRKEQTIMQGNQHGGM